MFILKRFLSIVFCLFILVLGNLTEMNKAFAYTDIDDSHANNEAIEFLTQIGAVEGYSDGAFKPEGTINRAEFLKMALEVSGKFSEVEEGGNCFPDVTDQWFAKYVCFAKANSIVDGYPDGFFYADREINFVEAAKMMVGILDIEYSKEPNAHYWFEPFLKTLSSKEIIPVTITSTDKYVNRGEVAEMLWRALEEEDLDVESLIYYFSASNIDIYTRLYKKYASKDGDLYYTNSKIEGGDISTFEALGDNYARDKNHLYYYFSVFEGVDFNTLELLGDGYAKDKNAVYPPNKDGATFDPNTFEVLDGDYVKDKDYVYLSGIQIEGVDAGTFEVLGSGYSRDKGSLYTRWLNAGVVDFDTFEILDHPFSKDKNHVYEVRDWNFLSISHNVLEELDPATAEVIKFEFIGDKDHVYCSNILIEGVTVENFEFVDHFSYVKGAELVYSVAGLPQDCDLRELDGVDASTFEYLGSKYSKDANSVYYFDILLTDADVGTFEVLDAYAKDQNSVYFWNASIEGVDVDSFVEKGPYYGVDKDQIYYCYNSVEGSDAASFEDLGRTDMYGYFKDKDTVYFMGHKDCDFFIELKDVDVETFEFLGEGYTKDKNSVYYENKKVEGQKLLHLK
jgi:hypothetical protein